YLWIKKEKMDFIYSNNIDNGIRNRYTRILMGNIAKLSGVQVPVCRIVSRDMFLNSDKEAAQSNG
ncbi:MAG: hypothetical protein NC429_15575, partial [Lachnospiraceae bacterium]|nr:hypothetical protein [Lachnospiraceae bacterium]